MQHEEKTLHDEMIALSQAICELLAERHATSRGGCGALGCVLASTLISGGIPKQSAMHVFSKTWDMIEREVTKPVRGEDLQFEFSPEIKADIARDPKLAATFRDMQARMREAIDGVATGRFADVDEAMRAIGGTKINLDDDDA
jgi:hypothetical protein